MYFGTTMNQEEECFRCGEPTRVGNQSLEFDAVVCLMCSAKITMGRFDADDTEAKLIRREWSQ